MNDNNTDTTDAPTRRETIKCGGTVIGGGLLAGCLGQSGDGSVSTTSPTERSAGGETARQQAATDDCPAVLDRVSPRRYLGRVRIVGVTHCSEVSVDDVRNSLAVE